MKREKQISKTMSTFNGIVEEFQNVSIDYYFEGNLKSTVFFLSHCHWDHMNGLENLLLGLKQYYLYASNVTIHILKKLFPSSTTNLIGLEIGVKYPIKIPDTDRTMCATLIPAGHCPGSVMFLFEGEKRVLYTGDIRIRVNELRKLKCFYDTTGELKKIDRIYLDTTFLNKGYLKFPMREDSLNEFLNLLTPMLKDDNHLIRFEVPAFIGSEFLFIKIAKHFKTKIHVSTNLYDIYKYIPEMRDIITLNGTETQIHSSCNQNGKKNYFCDRVNEGKYTSVKPAALAWRDCDFKNGIIQKRTFNTYCICYSSHCSYEELIDIIKFLKPLDIYSCVEPKTADDRKELDILIKDLLKEIRADLMKNKTQHQVNNQADDGEKSDDSWVVDDVKISQESEYDPFAFLNEQKPEIEKDDKFGESSEKQDHQNENNSLDEINWEIDRNDYVEISEESDHDPFDFLNK